MALTADRVSATAEVEAVAKALARRNLYNEPRVVAEATWDAWAEFAADAIAALDSLRASSQERQPGDSEPPADRPESWPPDVSDYLPGEER